MRFLLAFGLIVAGVGNAFALPSDEQFEALKSAPTVQHAKPIEDDILVAMMESGSPTADLVLERALLAEQVGEYGLARELIDRVLLIRPEFSEAWLHRALLFLNEEAYDQAILDLNEALVQEPRNFRAWLALGRIFTEFEKNKEALDAYRQVLKIYPLNQTAISEIRRLQPIVEGRAI